MKQLKSPVVVERRKRKRIVTLRNTGAALLALVVVVAALNIRSEMRDQGDDFGRLYQRELSKAPIVEATPAVEADVTAVDEAASADPFSLEAAAREQYLRSSVGEPVPSAAQWSGVVSIAGEDTGAAKVSIVGGPDGVELVREGRRAPVLSGGFGRE